MSRNLDTSLAAALSASSISPVVLAALTFVSGVMYVWSGVGNLVFNGNTYVGVGMLGKISPISESSDVRADGLEITLSGIGLSPFSLAAPPGLPIGVAPPATVPSGTNVAWVTATFNSTNTSNPAQGSAIATNSSAELNITATAEEVSATWSEFVMPVLPADAIITGIYALAVASSTGGTLTAIHGSGLDNAGLPEGGPFSGQYNSVNLGTDPSLVVGAGLSAVIGNSLDSNPNLINLDISNIGFAVYYTSSSNTSTMVQEALNDFQAGAPAQIYFGLMSNGALIGTPYLIFSGQIDQPTIDMSTQTASITLALESKLTNLMRPTARRYTAADQHLAYPDDIGFNWVETLNDIALRWGS